MSEYLNVLFYILCDENFYMKIIRSARKIPGIISISHYHGTNLVKASAEWNESEYNTRIKEIRKTAHVKGIKILKKTRRIVRSLREHVEVADDLKVKTVKARRIIRIIDTSIFRKAFEKNIRIKFLILGPGKNSKEFNTHRLALKKVIENDALQVADFPEDLKNESVNISIQEDDLAIKYNYVFILLMSTGSVSEFSSFLRKREIANKIWLFIPNKYRKSRGYLKTGPIKIFKGYYRRICYFDQPEDLLEKAKIIVTDILTFELHVK